MAHPNESMLDYLARNFKHRSIALRPQAFGNAETVSGSGKSNSVNYYYNTERLHTSLNFLTPVELDIAFANN